MTSLLNWLNTHTFLSPSISIMAWLGILAAIGITTLAAAFILFLVLADGQIGKPKQTG